MTPTQAENLRILIRHMETKVTRTLNMKHVSDRCGTAACAIGEACTVPELIARGQPRLQEIYNIDRVAANMFGMNTRLNDFKMGWARLFGASLAHTGRSEVTPQEWATEARKVLAENGYSMDDKPAEFIALVKSWEADPIPMWDIA